MKTKQVKVDKPIETTNDKKQRSTLSVRLISTVVLLVVLAIYIGAGIAYQELNNYKNDKWVELFSYASLAMSAVIVVYTTYEIVGAFTQLRKWYFILLFMIINLMLFILPTRENVYDFAFYKDWHFEQRYWSLILGVSFFAFVMVYLIVGISTKDFPFNKTLLLFAGALSIVFAFKGVSILMLSGPKIGEAGRFSYITLIWLWMLAIFADSFAYLFGRKWGKTKMAPMISPKKTWEGALVGLAVSISGGIIMALLLHFFAQDYQPFNYAILNLNGEWIQDLIIIILSIVFPIISILGDLFFSLIKRTLNIKDYSRLIPGHGGALDRLDSIILINSVAFLLVAFVH